MFLRSAYCVLFLLGAVTAMDDFLDCKGNKPNIFNILVRRCCEDEPQLPNDCECFSIEKESKYTNTKLHRPQCPEKFDARFLLYTRQNRNEYQTIKASGSSLADSDFQNGKPVKFITHGYTDKAPVGWNVEMKDAILDREDVNVILVDWEKGASVSFPGIYYKAVANVRTVGAMIAKLVTVFESNHGVAYSDVHLIGHSLGAHASGMAGKEIKRLTNQKIGRISGLDPAGPAFEEYKAKVRLDSGDAIFVDVMHTDAEPLNEAGFGIRKHIGTVDFDVNGGEHQPSCSAQDDSILSIFDMTDGQSVGLCSHSRATDYFTSSISQCTYDAGSGCVMGYDADPQYCMGVLDVTTTDIDSPYC